MGKFISRVIRSFAGVSAAPPPPPEVKPRAAVQAKVQPKAAVGAAAGPAGDDAKATTVRRRRGAPTQTIMTAAAGDTSDAPVQYKKLLGA